MSSGSTHQLDALTTTVSMNPGTYLSGANKVIAATKAMEAAVASFAASATASLAQVVSPAAMGGLATAITSISDALSKAAAPNKAAIADMGAALTGLSTAVKSFAGIKVNLSRLGSNLQSFGINLQTVAATAPGVTQFGRALGHIGTFLISAENLSVAKLDGVADGLGKFAKRFSGIASTLATDKVAATADSLRKLGGFLRAAGSFKFDPTAFDAMSSRVTGLFTNLSKVAPAVPVTGARSPAGQLAAVPPAAKSAARSVDSVNGRMQALTLTSLGLANAVNGVRLSFAGLAGFGLYSFAQTDDALARAMGHMDIMGSNEPGAKAGFLHEARRLSSQSTSSVTEMAQALDVLASSGLSAGASVRALSIAEDFAVASGMKMSEAVHKLTDLQVQLGLATEGNIEVHFAGLKKVSDMLVFAAAQSGTTEAQLAEAITAKLTTAGKRMELTAAETVAAVAVLSKTSKSLRGSTAGDTVARTIGIITEAAQNKVTTWEKMGMSAVDETGKFKNFLDVLDDINDRLADPNTAKLLAELGSAGLAPELKVVSPIELMAPLAKSIREMALQLEECDNAAKKMADTIRGSLQSQMKILWNATSVAANAMGEHLAPALSYVTAGVVGMMQAFFTAGPAFHNLAAVIAAVAVSTYALRLATPLLLAPFKALANVFIVMWNVGTAVAQTVLSIGLAIGKAVIGTAIGGWNALVWTFTKLSQLGEAVVTTVASVFEVTRDGAVVAAKAVYWLAVNSFGLLIARSQDAIDAFREVGKTIGVTVMAAVRTFATTAMAMVGNLLTAFMTLLTGVVTVALSLVAALALLPLILPVIAAGLSLIAAPVVTLAIGVAQLAAVIGTALVAAWNAAKQASVDALAWAGGKMAEVEANVVGTWKAVVEAASAIKSRLIPAITVVAGLLWNWRDNVVIVLDWLKKHGPEAFADVGRAAFNLIEILAGNFKQLGPLIVDSFLVAFRFVWNTSQSYMGAVFDWITNNWDDMLADMSSLTATFFTNLLHNFSLIASKVGRLFKMSYDEWISGTVLGQAAGGDQKAIMRENAVERAKILAGVAGEMRGPFDVGEGGKLPDMQRHVDSWKEVMKNTVGIKFWWETAGIQMGEAFTERMKALKPLEGAFTHIAESPIWQGLAASLNLAVPEGGLGAMVEWYKQMVKPETGEGGGNAVLPGGGGARYSFKQMSEARYVLGGEVAHAIEYQQLYTLRSMDGKLGQLVRVAGGVPENKGTPIRTAPKLMDSRDPN